MKLTLEDLKRFKPGVFARGYVGDDKDGVNMQGTGKCLKWVAERGEIHDWCIYVHWSENTYDFVKRQGDKVTRESHIKKLVDCDDEAFGMYRF